MKNILLIVILAAVVGVIWYFESTKVYVSKNQIQAINIPLGGAMAYASTTAASTPNINGTEVDSAAEPTPASLALIAAADQKAGYRPAIEIVDPTGFVNVSSTFKLSDLIGKKVILLEFWTYGCINCIHTLPYVTSWYAKYKDQGFEVVGIHTPEFGYEGEINNVEAAVKQYGIQYPVVLDNHYATWQAYGNLYWPHLYLIDIAGYIVYDHIGEGSYDETEAVIQKLLEERTAASGNATSSPDVLNADVSPPHSSGMGSKCQAPTSSSGEIACKE